MVGPVAARAARTARNALPMRRLLKIVVMNLLGPRTPDHRVNAVQLRIIDKETGIDGRGVGYDAQP